MDKIFGVDFERFVMGLFFTVMAILGAALLFLLGMLFTMAPGMVFVMMGAIVVILCSAWLIAKFGPEL